MHGVEPSRLSEEGKGEGQPMSSNDTDEGRAKNRCVDFVLPKKRLSNITQYGFSVLCYQRRTSGASILLVSIHIAHNNSKNIISNKNKTFFACVNYVCGIPCI